MQGYGLTHEFVSPHTIQEACMNLHQHLGHVCMTPS